MAHTKRASRNKTSKRKKGILPRNIWEAQTRSNKTFKNRDTNPACPENVIISNECNESTGSVNAKVNGYFYTCERVHSKKSGYLNKKCMKKSSKYHFLYNSPAFTKGRSKGKHRKFHFDTCLFKLFSFSLFIFVVPTRQSSQSPALSASHSGCRPGFLLTYVTSPLDRLLFRDSHQR